MKRKGFTLIELVVAMAIFLVLILIAFDAFNYVVLSSRYSRQVVDTQQNLSIVMDHITKELRQTVTNSSEPDPKGVVSPTFDPTSNTVRGLIDVLADTSKKPPLNEGEYYTFDSSKAPILRFYMYDDNGIKHRITYTLGAPNSSGSYSGIPQRYWPDTHYEPCEILYSNETWDGSSWTGTQNQPVTEQVITNFTVIRPHWSDKVIQIVIEAMVKGPTGKGAHKIRYIAQVTLRQ